MPGRGRWMGMVPKNHLPPCHGGSGVQATHGLRDTPISRRALEACSQVPPRYQSRPRRQPYGGYYGGKAVSYVRLPIRATWGPTTHT